MAAVKLMVLYPPPKDVQAFERVYLDEHVPMAVKKLAGKTKLVATKVQSSPQGKPAFHRIAEVHFPITRGPAGLRCVGRGEGNAGACRKDLDGRAACPSDRRGADAYVLMGLLNGAALHNGR